MNSKYIIFLLIILNFSITFAQEDGLPGSKPTFKSSTNFQALPLELKSKTAKFFNSLIDNKINVAYEDILKDTPLGKKTESVNDLKKQTTKLFELYGNIKSFDPVNYEMIGSSFVRLRYLGLHSRFPIRWIFTYYKSPDQGWIVTNIKFDDLTDFYFEDN